jgi:hypothetical protein
LDVLASNTDDSLVVSFGNVKRDFGGQFLLKHRETVKSSRIAAGNVDEEVIVVERLELDLDVGRLHDLVEFAVLLARDELAVFVRELDLEPDLVVERLRLMMREGLVNGE